MGTTGRAHRHSHIITDKEGHDAIEQAYQQDTENERFAVKVLTNRPMTSTLFAPEEVRLQWARDYLLVRCFELLKVIAED